jgi:hypothetical protein
MGAATVVDELEVAPVFDVVKLTASSGDTYISKLSSIVSVIYQRLTAGKTTGTATFSGTTVTISNPGMSSESVCLIIAGRL